MGRISTEKRGDERSRSAETEGVLKSAVSSSTSTSKVTSTTELPTTNGKETMTSVKLSGESELTTTTPVEEEKNESNDNSNNSETAKETTTTYHSTNENYRQQNSMNSQANETAKITQEESNMWKSAEFQEGMSDLTEESAEKNTTVIAPSSDVHTTTSQDSS